MPQGQCRNLVFAGVQVRIVIYDQSADPLLRATDAAEALVREGLPFRDAHERVAAEVRAGSFSPPANAAPRLGDVGASVRAAKERWSS